MGQGASVLTTSTLPDNIVISGADDTMDSLSSWLSGTDSVILSTNAVPGNILASSPMSPWNFNDTISIGELNTSNKIRLDGHDADIEVNGRSLVKTLEIIEQRLAILEPKPELESRWSRLKALGDEYRQLAAELEQGEKVWEILKK